MAYGLIVLVLGLNPVLADKAQLFIADGDLTAILAAIAAPALLGTRRTRSWRR